VPLARADEEALLEVGYRVTAVALLALVAALVLGWARLVPMSLVLLGGLYGAQLAVDDARLDAAAPLVALGLYLTSELAYWSLEERDGVEPEADERLRRLATIAGFALATLLVSALLVALVEGVRARGLAVDLLGAAAAAAVLLAIVLSARARPSARSR
jgi:hypothetical protein